MLFGEKLKKLRELKHLTQEEAAGLIGKSRSTIQKYEACSLYPRRQEVYRKIGEVFGVDPADLTSEEDRHVILAIEKGGAKARRDVRELVADVGGLFAGGELSEDDKDKVLKTITDLYWIAKERNKKYTPKKYISEQ